MKNYYLMEYERWLNNKNLDAELKKEVGSLICNEEIEDRFYKSLSFGTAGLRGKLGAGTNRMNIYTVSQATKALCKVILEDTSLNKSIAIAHDSRIMSKEFSELVARIAVTYGIKAYIFEDLRPTPELSFAIRHLKCISGVNITASHNPKEYNGYKVYWKDGAQIKSDIADRILDKIKDIDIFDTQTIIEFKEGVDVGLIEIIGEDIDNIYFDLVKKVSLKNNVDKDIKIVYTPLNGAGKNSVLKILKDMGYENVHLVVEQSEPDGNFPTVAYPNPEDSKAFTHAIEYAKKIKAELIIATDPDADRVSMRVLKDNNVIEFNGNQIGVLLVNYILENKFLRKDKKYGIIKSIVTGDMVVQIAKKYGVEVFNVLTGFKNIAELQNEWDDSGEYEFLFGFEESIGYNSGNFVRDKDAISSTLLIVEMAAYYKSKNKTLKDVLDGLYMEFGYYNNDTISFTFEGVSGQSTMNKIMDQFRTIPFEDISGIRVVNMKDYSTSLNKNLTNNSVEVIDIEKTNALEFILEDGSWFTLRPSGTEPKIKLYIYTKASSFDESKYKINQISNFVKYKIEG